MSRMASSITTDWDQFLKTTDPKAIALHLRSDEKLCVQGGLPTTLVYNLPAPSSYDADAIAIHLLPSEGRESIPSNIRRLMYISLRDRIKNYLDNMDALRSEGELDQFDDISPKKHPVDTLDGFQSHSRPEKGSITVSDPLETHTSNFSPCNAIDAADLAVAHKVLVSLTSTTALTMQDNIGDVLRVIEDEIQRKAKNEGAGYSRVRSEPMPMAAAAAAAAPTTTPPPVHVRKLCYICRFQVKIAHVSYPSLCVPCGEFNLAGSRISLPENLPLAGRTALVTGGRVNLGFHTALRLLRCGANVIVTSRYPRDAATRFSAEPDVNEWADRLNVLGADFRTAKDAFALVNAVKTVLTDRNTNLHILINNAAQTLTDSIQKEQNACQRERLLLQANPSNKFLLANANYEARVSGGGTPLIEAPPQSPANQASLDDDSVHQQYQGEIAGVKEYRALSELTHGATAPGPSSWVQSLPEIPYEDFVATFSINSLVPVILVRELTPYMIAPSVAADAFTSGGKSFRPVAYVINVSSREGIFEADPAHASKAGHHLHTNMSKAALNMMTETEAGVLWSRHHIAMNTVDPGYMSAAPEYENAHGGRRPIGWEDGAGRVLWPVAIGEREGRAVWGRFLKHYGATNVEVGRGR